jgi:hypothetical protein
MTEIIYGPNGARIELDADQCFPKDPGNGTPVMVYGAKPDQHATWNFAIGTGTYSGDDSAIGRETMRWLLAEEQYVEAWLDAAWALADKENR